jgi:hypothetical protein
MNYLQNFLDNKYTACYFRIIEKSHGRVLSVGEKHHIIPRSMGGTNVASNFAKLTPREHLICHILLTKMTDGNSKYKMLCAMNLMMQKSSKNHNRDYTRSSKLYQSLREEFVLHSKGRPKPVGFGEKIAESNRTRIVSERTKSRLREYNANRIFTDETREKMSIAAPKTKSDEHKKKIAKALTGKVRTKEHSENIARSLKARKLKLDEKTNKCDHSL